MNDYDITYITGCISNTCVSKVYIQILCIMFPSCIPAFPFDPPMQSDTYTSCHNDSTVHNGKGSSFPCS